MTTLPWLAILLHTFHTAGKYPVSHLRWPSGLDTNKLDPIWGHFCISDHNPTYTNASRDHNKRRQTRIDSTLFAPFFMGILASYLLYTKTPTPTATMMTNTFTTDAGQRCQWTQQQWRLLPGAGCCLSRFQRDIGHYIWWDTLAIIAKRHDSLNASC